MALDADQGASDLAGPGLPSDLHPMVRRGQAEIGGDGFGELGIEVLAGMNQPDGRTEEINEWGELDDLGACAVDDGD